MSASFAVAREGILAEAAAKEVVEVHPSLGASTASESALSVAVVGKESLAGRELRGVVGARIGQVEGGNVGVLVRGFKCEAIG